jgi:hypothetical protein
LASRVNPRDSKTGSSSAGCANLSIYTIHGTEGVGGVVDESTSLLLIMAKCEDFKTGAIAMHELMEVLGIGMEHWDGEDFRRPP